MLAKIEMFQMPKSLLKNGELDFVDLQRAAQTLSERLGQKPKTRSRVKEPVSPRQQASKPGPASLRR